MEKIKMMTLCAALFASASVFAAKDAVKEVAKEPTKETEVQNIKMTVTDNGFEPNQIKVSPDIPVVLHITRKTNGTCAREIEVPSRKIKVELPMNKEVAVNLGKLSKGEIKFGCSMEMMVGGVMFVQ